MWMLAGALIAIAIIVYWPAISNGFVSYDDPDYVTRNYLVRQGLTWEGISWAFGSLAVANWHPLAWVSHMIDCELYGIDPRGHHVTSIVLHAVSAGLLLILLTQMTGMLWRSALLAAVFALHPQHVQNVAWVAERKDVLSVMFGSLTLVSYVAYVQRGGTVRYVIVLVLYALALLAKPMLVTLPVLMMLLDIWPLRRWTRDGSRRCVPRTTLRSQIIKKSPLLAMALASSIITVIAQKRGGTVGTLDMIPLDARLTNAIVGYAWYVRSTFWPTDLAVFYPHPGRWPTSTIVWSAIMLTVITIGSLLFAKRRPAILSGWLWFVIALLPVIGIVQVGSQAYADRYSYLPHIGLFIMIAFGLPCVSNTAVRALYWIGGIAAVAACAIATRAELPHWSGSWTLYERAIAVTTNNWLAHLNLGNEMLRQNNAAEARRQFESALRVRPLMAEAHYGLGQAYAQLGLMNEAAQSWREAERLQPDYAAPRYSRALALLSQGQFEQAMSLLDEALRLDPEMADAHLLKGIVLMDQGRTEEALIHLQAATRFAPDNETAAEELRKASEVRGGPKQAR
jgi:Tfp pilus assembly protein PilF